MGWDQPLHLLTRSRAGPLYLQAHMTGCRLGQVTAPTDMAEYQAWGPVSDHNTTKCVRAGSRACEAQTQSEGLSN